MNRWTDWEVVRRQVAVCGRVLALDGLPAAQACVTVDRVSEAPSGRARRAGRGTPPAPPARSPAGSAMAQFDGCFFLLDLPAGRYVATALDRGGRLRGSAPFSVSCDGETVRRATVDLRLERDGAAGAPGAPDAPDASKTGKSTRE